MNQSSKSAIAPPQSPPAQSAPIWSGLLVGALLTIATPTAAATSSQTAAVTGWSIRTTQHHIAQSMPDSMPDSMPHSATDPATDPDTSFQRIDQPVGIKALITIAGLALIAGELWWFLSHHVKSES